MAAVEKRKQLDKWAADADARREAERRRLRDEEEASRQRVHDEGFDHVPLEWADSVRSVWDKQGVIDIHTSFMYLPCGLFAKSPIEGTHMKHVIGAAEAEMRTIKQGTSRARRKRALKHVLKHPEGIIGRAAMEKLK